MAIKFTTQPVAKNATSRSLDSLSAAECKLQDKTVEYVENSQYEILPDEGYDGIAKVDVTVNVPIPEPKLQSKNYNIVTNGDTTITPDAGFVGINGGTISVNVPTPEPKLQEKSTTISQNGASSVTPDSGYDGLSRVDITVQVPEKTIQANKTVSITTNGQTIVSPDPNNDGMAQVTVDVNVSGGGSINIAENGIKLAYSTFTEVPDVFTGWDKLEDGSRMLYECENLTSFDKDVSNCTNIDYMFSYSGITSYNYNFPLVTTANQPFKSAKITSITGDLTNLTGQTQFFGHSDLVSFDLDTPNITDTYEMFIYCYSMKTCTANISKVTIASYMFQSCTVLKDLTLTVDTEFNASNMFYHCRSLKNVVIKGTLNASSLDFLSSPFLTVDSMMNIINALADLTGQDSKEIIFGTSLLNQLSEEQKAVATNKNWVLA